MNKLLKILRSLGTSILTIVLIILISSYVVILNFKISISEQGIKKALKKTDIVELINSSEDVNMNKNIRNLATSLKLTEDEFKQMLRSERLKEQLGSYVSNIIRYSFDGKNVILSKEDVQKLLEVAIDEYNDVSETKINDNKRKEIIGSFSQEMIDVINDEFSSINLRETAGPKYVKYVDFTKNILFGSYTSNFLYLILFVIILIALLRFSYYKWITNVKVSLVFSGIFVIFIIATFSAITVTGIDLMMSFKEVFLTNISISVGVILALLVILTILERQLRKYVKKKSEMEKMYIVQETQNL